MANDPFKYFRVEARELVDQLGKGVLDLERGETGVMAKLLRLAHTLKGAARVVRRPDVAELAHAIEDVLTPYREGGLVPREAIDQSLDLLDRIASGIANLTPPGEAEKPAAPRPQTTSAAAAPAAQEPEQAAGGDAYRTVWAEIGELDSLLDGVTETHTQLTGLSRIASDLGQAKVLAEHLVNQMAVRASREAQPTQRSDRLAATAEDLRSLVSRLERSLAGTHERIERELAQVHDTAEQLRLVPAGSLFAFLERAARDVARAMGKSVSFEAKGGGIRLDSHVLRVMHEALLQVVRNAVAHGIEHAGERVAAGKPPAGTVSVSVTRRGRNVAFRCSDDGRGIDIDAIRRAAIGRGARVAETGALAGSEILDLLGGGVSTSERLTEVSGRGVGVGVVRDAVARLRGGVGVETERGRGTTFEIVVPLSLASVETLVVRADGQSVGIPFEAVSRVLRLSDAQLSNSPGGARLIHDGQAMPFASLARILGRGTGDGRQSTAVVLRSGDRHAAIGVDAVEGAANVVLRSLPDHAFATAIIAGAVLDAEGNPQAVFDAEALVTEIERQGGIVREDAEKVRPILIVDDSLTTRMLEQSILESAGYDVELAICAEDALEMARRQRYAMFLVDVEMPGMNGFSFIEQIRGDPVLHETPAILVTSLSDAADRRRGDEVGANGYVVKSEFNQAELLRMIGELVR